MPSFDDFVEAVQDGARELARETFDDYLDDARNDARSFIANCEDDLRRWINMLEQGDLDQQEFSDLVNGQKSLAQIHLLTQKGIALTKLERFRSGLIDLVINTALDLFL